MRRRRLAALYREVLGQVAPGVMCVPPEYRHEASHQVMPVVLPRTVDRHQVVHALDEQGIASRALQPLHRSQGLAHDVGSPPPHAERLADSVLLLPLHPGMRETDVDRVCDVLASCMS
jgi:dTDP-4-amino-4,6-dideoxygalactose transaminase